MILLFSIGNLASNYYIFALFMILIDKLLKVSSLENKKNFEDYKKKTIQIFDELKAFIKLMVETIIIYYRLGDYEKVLQYNLFTKENLINFITSVLFDDQVILKKNMF